MKKAKEIILLVFIFINDASQLLPGWNFPQNLPYHIVNVKEQNWILCFSSVFCVSDFGTDVYIWVYTEVCLDMYYPFGSTDGKHI